MNAERKPEHAANMHESGLSTAADVQQSSRHSPSPLELQNRMSHLMQQLHGVMSQMRVTNPAAPGGTSPPNSSMDETEANALIQAATNYHQNNRGASPPMDPDAWMTMMMGSLPAGGGQQQQPPRGNFQGSIPPPFVPRGGGGKGVQPNFPAPTFTGTNARPPYVAPSQQQQQQPQTFVPNHLAAPFEPQQQQPQRGGRGGGPRGHPRQSRSHDADMAPCNSYGFVEFKRQRIKKYPCTADVAPGQYVIVDGDRGQDCGLLVQLTITRDDGRVEVQSMDGSHINNGHRMKVEVGRVLRAANTSEIDLLHNELANLERTALKTCRQRCQELGLEIDVMDCEYQFDMKKISFYFNSDHSVDFRDLVRELYRAFGARIWMENVNPHVKNVVPTGTRASQQLQPGMLGGGGSNSALASPSSDTMMSSPLNQQ